MEYPINKPAFIAQKLNELVNTHTPLIVRRKKEDEILKKRRTTFLVTKPSTSTVNNKHFKYRRSLAINDHKDDMDPFILSLIDSLTKRKDSSAKKIMISNKLTPADQLIIELDKPKVGKNKKNAPVEGTRDLKVSFKVFISEN